MKTLVLVGKNQGCSFFSKAVSGDCNYFPFCGSKSHGCKYDHSANGICPSQHERGLGIGTSDGNGCVTRVPQCLLPDVDGEELLIFLVWIRLNQTQNCFAETSVNVLSA